MSVLSILVKLSIFYRPQRHANSNNGDGRPRSVSFGYIFWDFPWEWSCFSMSSSANYEALDSKNWIFKCVVLSRKGARFMSLKGNLKQKLSFYIETCANRAILYWPVKGFSHSFIDLTLLFCFPWFQKLIKLDCVTLDRSFILALIYVALWSNHTVLNFTSNYFETYFCQVFILKKIRKNRTFGFLVPNAL